MSLNLELAKAVTNQPHLAIVVIQASKAMLDLNANLAAAIQQATARHDQVTRTATLDQAVSKKHARHIRREQMTAKNASTHFKPKTKNRRGAAGVQRMCSGCHWPVKHAERHAICHSARDLGCTRNGVPIKCAKCRLTLDQHKTRCDRDGPHKFDELDDIVLDFIV
jgi:hypothetical protein